MYFINKCIILSGPLACLSDRECNAKALAKELELARLIGLLQQHRLTALCPLRKLGGDVVLLAGEFCHMAVAILRLDLEPHLDLSHNVGERGLKGLDVRRVVEVAVLRRAHRLECRLVDIRAHAHDGQVEVWDVRTGCERAQIIKQDG